MDLQDYKIKNSITCDCGYVFTLHDVTDLKRINDSKFYGGNIKQVSETHCPLCLRKTLLLLKQVRQTYQIIDIAQKDRPIIETKTIRIDENSTEQTQINSNEVDSTSNEFICQNCKRVFKTKQGLTIHSKSCGK